MPISLTDDTNIVHPNTLKAHAWGNVLDNDIAGTGTISFDGIEAGALPQTIQGGFGTLTFSDDGSYIYIPFAWMHADVHIALGNMRADSFNYTVTDGIDTGTAVLTIDLTSSATAYTTRISGFDFSETIVRVAGVNHAVGASGNLRNGTYSSVARDFDGSKAWDLAWSVESDGPKQTSHSGFLSDHGTVTLVTHNTSQDTGWKTQLRSSDGMPGLQFSDALGMGVRDVLLVAADYTGGRLNSRSGSTETIQFRDMASAASKLSMLRETAVEPTVRLLNDGAVFTTTFDPLMNPAQTFTGTMTNAGDNTVIGHMTFRADGINIRNNINPSNSDIEQILYDADGSRGWTTITRQIIDGDIRNVQVKKDNGDTMATKLDADGAYNVIYTDGQDKRAWLTKDSSYSNADLLMSDTFVFADGLEMRREYDPRGEMTARFRYDSEDAKPWDKVSENYTNGVLTKLFVQQDDFDLVITDYSDTGVMESRTFFDFAGNQSWNNRTWHYDDQGAVTSVETDMVDMV